MGGHGSGGSKFRKVYNIKGLGQLKLSTIARLIEKNWITVVLSKGLEQTMKEYDAVIIDDKNDKIIIKGIKKIVEL